MQRAVTVLVFFVLIVHSADAQTRIPITLSGTLPPSVDNTTASWFPPVVDEDNTMGCGNSTGIGWVFTYEMNWARNIPSNRAENHFHWIYTYDFLNAGSRDTGTYAMFFDTWKIAQENGIVNTADFTGTSNGSLESILDIRNMETNSLTYTKWPSGYDMYYRAMHCRVDDIDSFEVKDSLSLLKMKQWLMDHGNGSSGGGIFVFTANIYSTQSTTLPVGTPEGGKKLIKLWGPNISSQHAMAIVAYNDSIRFDFNRDGQYTNDLDISNEEGVIGSKDNKITMADWEIGGYKAANTWGTGWMDGNGGIAWTPYRSFGISHLNGGITNRGRVYYITIRKDYEPRMALKIALTHERRNDIALSVGVAPGAAVTAPSKIRRFERQFTYSGGAFPLCGNGASPSIELGFDISDLLDSIPQQTSATFFLVVDSKGQSGRVDALSLMDYTSGMLQQTKSPQTGVAIISGTPKNPSTTYVSVSTDLTGVSVFSRPHSPRRERYIRFRNQDIQVRIPEANIDHLSISDISGRLLSSIACNDYKSVFSINKKLPAGTYILTVRGADGTNRSRRLLLK